MEKAITAQIQKYRNTYISIIKGKRREVSMDIKQIKENKIRMILQFSIPSIIAMLLQTVITITDGYFTGNYVGQDALAAINLGLPILYFYLGTGLKCRLHIFAHSLRHNSQFFGLFQPVASVMLIILMKNIRI